MFSGEPEPFPGALRDGKDRIIASVASLAASSDIRAIRGGGTVFALHGLISPRVPRFTAFIVDPAAVGALTGLLELEGWKLETSRHTGQLLPRAIVRLVRDDFDGVIHLHGVIPGFFADPAAVFDLMWANRDQMAVSGVVVPVLDRLCTVILAAHDRLDGQRYRRRMEGENFAYFVTQFRAALSTEERETLAWNVGVFGADDELRPLLEGLALPLGKPAAPTEAYVRGRLGRDVVTPGDLWLIEHLERPRSHREHGTSVVSVSAAFIRLLRARRRALAAGG